MTGVSPLAVDPETLKALEGGIKSDITPWLRANLALYRYDYKDLQVTARDPLGPGYVLQNAANATLYGGELETTLAPTDHFRVNAAVAYAHAEYDDFPLAQVFIPGQREAISCRKRMCRATAYRGHLAGPLTSLQVSTYRSHREC